MARGSAPEGDRFLPAENPAAAAATGGRVVSELTRSLLQTPPDGFGEVLDGLATALGERLGVDAVVVCGSGPLAALGCATWWADGRRDGQEVDTDGLIAAAARAADDHEAAWCVPDLAAVAVDVPALAPFADAGLGCMLIVPLRVEGSTVGLLTLASRVSRHWESALTERLHGLGLVVESLALRSSDDGTTALNRRFRDILDGQTEMICRFTPDLRITYANKAYASQYDHTPESIIGYSLLDFFPEEAHDWARAEVARLGPDLPVNSHENEVVSGDGSRSWYQWTDTVTFDADGQVAEIQAVGRDVSESHRLGAAIRRSEERFRRAFENAPIGMALLDDDQAIVSANQALLRFFNLGSHSALEGHRLPDLVVDASRTGRHDDTPLGEEMRLRRADGSLRWAAVSVSTLEGGDQGVRLMQVVDLEDRKRAEQQLEHEALHDPLTGLPNRTLLLDRLAHALQRRERDGGDVALLFGDLDQFKLVNDSFGHEIGDRLLRLVTQRLTGALRAHDTLARFGGDEFVILAEGLESPQDTEELGRRITAALAAPLNLGVAEVSVGISLGIALADERATPSELIRRADTAMYDAKEGPQPRIAYYDRTSERRLAGRLSLRTRLDRALASDEFVAVYQPIVDRDGVAIGTEALLRWDRGDGVLREPTSFLAMAQEMGLIVPIGKRTLRRACAQAVEWSHTSGRPVQAWVNVGGREITQASFVDSVVEVLEDTGLRPQQLCLELTEWSVLEDVAAVAGRVHELHEAGVRFALDDFGTGYSALDFLRRFTLDVVKIDGAFVRGLLDDATNDYALVTAIAGLGEALGLTVVGEGVEHRDQAAALRRLGVPLMQGFGVAAPALPEQLGSWFGVDDVHGVTAARDARRGGRDADSIETPVSASGSAA